MVLFQISLLIRTECPPSQLIFPCVCRNDTFTLVWYSKQTSGLNIYCSGNEKINLEAIFKDMSLYLEESDKHFNLFHLNNTAIIMLGDNIFRDITFNIISIRGAQNLTRIQSNAFSSHNTQTVREIHVTDQYNIDEQYISEFYNALSSLENVNFICIYLNKLGKSLPTNAFKLVNKSQNLLTYTVLKSNEIESIGNYAFYYMENLRSLDLISNKINHISKHAFDFFQPSNNTLLIYLEYNNLNDTSIEFGAFIESKRPLQIRLIHNKFTYLDEDIFDHILRIDKRNTILISDNPLECDCRMSWIIRDKSVFSNQIQNITCKNGEDFFSLNARDFDYCNE